MHLLLYRWFEKTFVKIQIFTYHLISTRFSIQQRVFPYLSLQHYPVPVQTSEYGRTDRKVHSLHLLYYMQIVFDIHNNSIKVTHVTFLDFWCNAATNHPRNTAITSNTKRVTSLCDVFSKKKRRWTIKNTKLYERVGDGFWTYIAWQVRVHNAPCSLKFSSFVLHLRLALALALGATKLFFPSKL